MTDAVCEQLIRIDDQFAERRSRRSRGGNHSEWYRHKRLEVLQATPHLDIMKRIEYMELREQLLTRKFPQAVRSPTPTSVGGSGARALADSSLSALSASAMPAASTHRAPSSSPRLPRARSRVSALSPSEEASDKPIVPTKYADASRAMAGTSISVGENYAFSGMHYIFDQHKGPITAVKFAHDSHDLLCMSSEDGTLSLCACLPSARVLHTLRGHSGPVNNFEWSQQNDFVLSVSNDGTARLWDTSSGVCLRVMRSDDKTPSPFLSCVFHSVNNNVVLVTQERGRLLAFNMSTGKQTGAVKVGSSAATCLAMDAQGETIFTGTQSGSILAFRFASTTGSFTRLPRATTAVTTLSLSSAPTSASAKKSAVPCAVTSLAYRAWVSRESRTPYLLCSAQNQLLLYHVIGLDTLSASSRKGQSCFVLACAFPVLQTSVPIKSSFCPLMSFLEGACVVTGSEDCNVYFFDIVRKINVNKLQGHMAPVTAVSWNNDESLLASGSLDGVVIVWNRLRLTKQSV